MLTVERGLPAELHAFINGLKQQYTMEFVAHPLQAGLPARVRAARA